MSSLSETQRQQVQQYNARLGLWLFAIYLVLYLGFVFLSAFAPSSMDQEVLAGLNLAIVYGFALIVGAFLMAMLYGVLCRTEPTKSSPIPPAESTSETSDSPGRVGEGDQA
jgi:uncharacterized membrane protein (DUF485 family)